MIKVRYTSIDRCNTTRTFKTIEGARKFAQHWVGETPELGAQRSYAVSFDGIGKVVCTGCTLMDLFPKLATEAAAEARLYARSWDINMIEAESDHYFDARQEHDDYEANADADYIREAYAGMTETREQLDAEAKDRFEEDCERTCDDIETQGAKFGRVWTGSYPTDEIPF
jgi:hypothetical protein